MHFSVPRVRSVDNYIGNVYKKYIYVYYSCMGFFQLNRFCLHEITKFKFVSFLHQIVQRVLWVMVMFLVSIGDWYNEHKQNKKFKWRQWDWNPQPLSLLTKNLTIWPVWLNGWVFVYKLSGCGFKSCCCHLNFRYYACFEQGDPWHSGNYRV